MLEPVQAFSGRVGVVGTELGYWESTVVTSLTYSVFLFVNWIMRYSTWLFFFSFVVRNESTAANVISSFPFLHETSTTTAYASHRVRV